MTDLIARDNRSVALLAREEGRPRGYPAATVPAASVEVLVRFVDEPVGSGKRVCVLAPGGSSFYEYTRDLDRPVVLMTRAFSPAGTADVSSLTDAHSVEVPISRETDAPVIGQNKPATAGEVEIGITGFTRFARFRRVSIWADAEMSVPLLILTYDSANYSARELPRYLTLSRRVGVLTTQGESELLLEDGSKLVVEDDAASLPQTIYITVAHSGGATWTPESEILEATFAGVDGTPGSGGDFDPTPRDKESLDLIV